MEDFITGAYMVCAILFILSLGGLSNQETAKSGNLYGVLAMTLAIVAAFFEDDYDYHYELWGPAFALGGIIGTCVALRVEMISMPQLVAALHSFVGLAATLVAFAFFFLHEEKDALPVIETTVGIFIGAVTFTGSVVAWGKLDGKIRSNPLIICGSGRHFINLFGIGGCIALALLFAFFDETFDMFLCLLGIAVISGFIGWHLVMAIGGADMPVVVSMLNSYSGWATAASGFLLENDLLVITGALVGSSGAILSYIMCQAMNRSFFSVIAGGFGQGMAPPSSAEKPEGEIVETSLSELCGWLREAKRVVIVPGYGMAVARCQHDVGTMASILRNSGRTVEFCIHPVAGRLPGHMNVLLAEAEVDYKIVKEMDEINPHFPETDLTLVIGANDIVNPDAQDNPNSPIAGMPVCEVWQSKHVVVFKRGGGVGYAGIENPLFYKTNTRMFYGNADKSVKSILNEITNDSAFKAASDNVDQNEESDGEEKNEEPEVFPDAVMSIGVPKEIWKEEKRVAVTPSMVSKFRRLGFSVKVESKAGDGATFTDQSYEEAGASIVDTQEVWNSDIVLKIRKLEFHPALNKHEDTLLANVKCLVSYVFPANNKEWLQDLGKRYPQLTYLAIDCVPRTTKAQKLDSLSSMANIGGYRAVIEAFEQFKRCPKPMITAAGKLPPADVLIIGAGVAGLSAIGYCKNLGCQVKALDTRPAARQDAESMGAKFLTVNVKEEGTGVGGYAKVMSDEYQKAQYELTRKTARKTDIIITTALIPGRPAPKLLDEGIVREMKNGSVVVDMAAEMGGNCSMTKPGEVFVTENGVRIVGYTDLVSRMAPQSSELYANNMWNLLDEMGGAQNFKMDKNDEIIGPIIVMEKGNLAWEPPKPPAAAPSQPGKPAEVAKVEPAKDEGPGKYDWLLLSAVLIGTFVGLAYATYTSFMTSVLIFVLSIFIGYMVIWNVTPSLHTPLMSVTNAISGIIIIGAMLTLDANDDEWIDEGSALGVCAVFFASINIWGGFIVTQRMLNMFKTNK